MKDTPPSPSQAVAMAYFNGNATPLERRLIEDWLTTPEGVALYFSYLDDWERQQPQFYPDLEAARQRFGQFMSQSDKPERVIYPLPVATSARPKLVRTLRLRWLTGLAAALVLTLGLWLSTDSWYYTAQVSGNGQIRTFTLPDGSGIVLGANSALRYARFGFDRGPRRVWLTGEAEFRVIHRADSQRFTVETPEHTTVEVLGTVFTVNSRRNQTRVVLQTGRIRLTTPQTRQPLVLAPGDVVTVDDGAKPHQQHRAAASARVTWHDHRFVFADTPLTQVADQLHDTFGITVQIPQNELLRRTVSGTFQAETADDLLEALTLMMNLHVEQDRTVYVLME